MSIDLHAGSAANSPKRGVEPRQVQRRRFRSALSALGLAIVLPNLALADPGALASATLSNFSISLTDLDLTDGIGASYSFFGLAPNQQMKATTMASLTLLPTSGSEFRGETNVPGSAFQIDLNSQVIRPDGFAIARTDSSHFVSASGAVSVSGGYFQAIAVFESLVDRLQNPPASGPGPRILGGLLLSPNTTLTFSASARAEARIRDACTTIGAIICSEANALAAIGGSLYAIDSGVELEEVKDIFEDKLVAEGPGSFDIVNNVMMRDLRVVLTNNSDVSVMADLFAEAWVHGTSATPVPEPGTLALALMGLAALAGNRVVPGVSRSRPNLANGLAGS